MAIPSLLLLFFIITLPYWFISRIIWSSFGKSRFRKYKKNYIESANLFIILKIFSFEPSDCWIFAFYHAKFITSLWGSKYRSKLSRPLPNFNEPYDMFSFWIKKSSNRSVSDPIIIYLHGGGYKFQLGPGQFKALLGLNELIDEKAATRLSILMFDYSLATHGVKFPRQKEELKITYEKLTQQDGNTNIIVLGDSAGAHLILSFLQDLSKLEEKKLLANIVYPKHLILVSPWIRTIMKHENEVPPTHSIFVNKDLDYLTLGKYNKPSAIFNIFGNTDMLLINNDPGRSPISRAEWQTIPTFSNNTSSIFVLFGGDEIFRDDIIEWCNTVLDTNISPDTFNESKSGEYVPEFHEYLVNDKPNHSKAIVYVEPLGVHDASFVIEGESILRNILPKGTKLEEIDRDEFFGLYRIAKHLNKILQ